MEVIAIRDHGFRAPRYIFTQSISTAVHGIGDKYVLVMVPGTHGGDQDDAATLKDIQDASPTDLFTSSHNRLAQTVYKMKSQKRRD